MRVILRALCERAFARACARARAMCCAHLAPAPDSAPCMRTCLRGGVGVAAGLVKGEAVAAPSAGTKRARVEYASVAYYCSPHLDLLYLHYFGLDLPCVHALFLDVALLARSCLARALLTLSLLYSTTILDASGYACTCVCLV